MRLLYRGPAAGCRGFSRRYKAALCGGFMDRCRSIAAATQDLALADVVGRADHALALHALDDARGAVVADLQVPLDEAGRGFAFAQHQVDRLIVELIARALAVLGERRHLVLLVGGDVLEISRRRPVLLEEADDRFDL